MQAYFRLRSISKSAGTCYSSILAPREATPLHQQQSSPPWRNRPRNLLSGPSPIHKSKTSLKPSHANSASDDSSSQTTLPQQYARQSHTVHSPPNEKEQDPRWRWSRSVPQSRKPRPKEHREGRQEEEGCEGKGGRSRCACWWPWLARARRRKGEAYYDEEGRQEEAKGRTPRDGIRCSIYERHHPRYQVQVQCRKGSNQGRRSG